MALPDTALFTNSRPFCKPSMPIPPAHRRDGGWQYHYDITGRMIALDAVSAFCSWLTSAKRSQGSIAALQLQSENPLTFTWYAPSAASPWSPSPDKMPGALEVIGRNEGFIKMTLTVMVTPE